MRRLVMAFMAFWILTGSLAGCHGCLHWHHIHLDDHGGHGHGRGGGHGGRH